MKKSRFTESQIVSILAKAEQGHKIVDLCREHGINHKRLYRIYTSMGLNIRRREDPL